MKNISKILALSLVLVAVGCNKKDDYKYNKSPLQSIIIVMDDYVTDEFKFPNLDELELDGFFVLENDRPITPYYIKLIGQENYMTSENRNASRVALLCMMSENQIEKLSKHDIKAFLIENAITDETLIYLPMKISCKDIKSSQNYLKNIN